MLWVGCCHCATTKEDWPAALDFPPANKSYKLPVLLGSAQWTQQPWPGTLWESRRRIGSLGQRQLPVSPQDLS